MQLSRSNVPALFEQHAREFLTLLVQEFPALFSSADMEARRALRRRVLGRRRGSSRSPDAVRHGYMRGNLRYCYICEAIEALAERTGHRCTPQRREGIIMRSPEVEAGPILFCLGSRNFNNDHVKSTQRHREVCHSTSYSQETFPGFDVDPTEIIIETMDRWVVAISYKPRRGSPGEMGELTASFLVGERGVEVAWGRFDLAKIVAEFGATIQPAEIIPTQVGPTVPEEIQVPKPVPAIRTRKNEVS